MTAPLFVLQLHQATHLHHDLRLEVDGVLVSWAVPKGPPTEPGVRRLAVRVGDHDLAHAEVEGPQERGWVEIVDRGGYENLTTRRGAPLSMTDALAAGHVKVRLHGEHLDGTYALTRTAMGGDDRHWLLVLVASPRPGRPVDRRGSWAPHAGDPRLTGSSPGVSRGSGGRRLVLAAPRGWTTPSSAGWWLPRTACCRVGRSWLPRAATSTSSGSCDVAKDVAKDVAHDAQRTVVELDGRLGHEEAAGVWDDLDRDLAAAADGLLTLRAGWRHVLEPCRLVVSIAAILAACGRVGAVACCRTCGDGRGSSASDAGDPRPSVA